MNIEAESKLKFDRRLRDRRGWVSDEELQAELDSLPDVAEKVLAPDEEPERSVSAKAAPTGRTPGSGTPGL